MIKTVDWSEIRSGLDMINQMALSDLMDFLRVISDMDRNQARAYLQEAMPILIDTYGSVATDLSVEWWDDLFEGVEHPPVVVPEPPPRQMVVAQTGWAADTMFKGGNLQSRLASIVRQHIYGAQRETVATNSDVLSVRYARQAQANACSFCRVLASRGAVYGSAARARYVGASGSSEHYSQGRSRGRRFTQGRVRGVRKAGQTYHDHCRCVVGPEVSHLDLNLPDYYDKFNDEYNQAIRLLDRETDDRGNYSMSDVTRAMRSLGFAA